MRYGARINQQKRDAHAHVQKQTMAALAAALWFVNVCQSRLLSYCGHVVLARECKHTHSR